MYDIFNVNNFAFRKISFNKYHYTDNRNGSQMNYLAYMIKGTAKIVSKNITVDIKSGDVFFIPINLPYESYWYGNNETEFLSYGFVNIEASESLNFRLQIIDCDENLKKKIANIPTEGFSLSCKTLALFYDVLSEILPYLKQNKIYSKKEELIIQAKKYISLHPDCSVPDLVKELYISEPYLYLLFKNNLGYTPHEYKLRVKCKKGINLLLTTDKSVEEISNLVGFSSASHFRKVLKSQTGLVPKEIRKKSVF